MWVYVSVCSLFYSFNKSLLSVYTVPGTGCRQPLEGWGEKLHTQYMIRYSNSAQEGGMGCGGNEALLGGGGQGVLEGEMQESREGAPWAQRPASTSRAGGGH